MKTLFQIRKLLRTPKYFYAATNFDQVLRDKSGNIYRSENYRNCACFGLGNTEHNLTGEYAILIFPPSSPLNVYHYTLCSIPEMRVLMDDISELYDVPYSIEQDSKTKIITIHVTIDGWWKQHLAVLTLIRHLYEFPSSFFYWQYLYFKDRYDYIKELGPVRFMAYASQFEYPLFVQFSDNRIIPLGESFLYRIGTREEIKEKYKNMNPSSPVTRVLTVGQSIPIEKLKGLDKTFMSRPLKYSYNTERTRFDTPDFSVKELLDNIEKMFSHNLKIINEYNQHVE